MDIVCIWFLNVKFRFYICCSTESQVMKLRTSVSITSLLWILATITSSDDFIMASPLNHHRLTRLVLQSSDREHAHNDTAKSSEAKLCEHSAPERVYDDKPLAEQELVKNRKGAIRIPLTKGIVSTASSKDNFILRMSPKGEPISKDVLRILQKNMAVPRISQVNEGTIPRIPRKEDAFSKNFKKEDGIPRIPQKGDVIPRITQKDNIPAKLVSKEDSTPGVCKKDSNYKMSKPDKISSRNSLQGANKVTLKMSRITKATNMVPRIPQEDIVTPKMSLVVKPGYVQPRTEKPAMTGKVAMPENITSGGTVPEDINNDVRMAGVIEPIRTLRRHRALSDSLAVHMHHKDLCQLVCRKCEVVLSRRWSGLCQKNCQAFRNEEDREIGVSFRMCFTVWHAHMHDKSAS